MIEAPPLHNAPARFAALNEYRVLDTAPEPAFDDLARLAAQLCATPIAMIGFADARRVWFKSKIGLDTVEMPRESAFFSSTIQQENEIIVPEAVCDERFAMDPLVTCAPYIRFFAGVPLKTAMGQPLGLLCVMDHAPRRIRTEQMAALQALGRQVTAQVELRRHAMNLEYAGLQTADALARLAALLESTPDLVASFDPSGRALSINRAGRQMLGLGLTADISALNLIGYHPAWAQAVILEQAEPAIFRDGLWTGETAVIAPDGREVPLSQVIIAHKTPDGEIAFFSTIARDISEHKRAEVERARLQEEVIRAQDAALAELSTPLIPISDTVMVMPLIGAMDSRRAQQVVDELLNGISQHHAQVAILDITGVPVVDTQVANGLIRAAQAVKLLGAQVVLTGIRPEVAQTLVGLGTSLEGIVTRSTLQSGIAFAMRGR
jgi:PAS domain S-box-containing protein